MIELTQSFGYWLRRRRKALDLTQEALAQRVSCSAFSIRKIEADERRPSRGLADRLATMLCVVPQDRAAFFGLARAARGPQGLSVTSRPLLDADAAHSGEPRPVEAGALAGGRPALMPAGAVMGALPPAPTDPAADGPAVGARGGDAAPFVGRSKELGLLDWLLDQLGSGAGCTVLVEGEPGIGKSRLLRELARRARERGMPTLATKCWEVESAIPYQPVIKLVSDALDHLDAAARQGLAPVSLAEIAALMPEVGERFPGLPQISADVPEVRKARLPRAVDQLLDAARRGRPAILMVDDLQWADGASAQVFQLLARAAAQRPVLVVYAYRDEALASDAGLAARIDSLRRETHARRLLLGRLAATETEAIVAALAPAVLGAAAAGAAGPVDGAPGLGAGARTLPSIAELALRLHRETDGNPFFLLSILQSLVEGETQLLAPAGADEGDGGAASLLPDTLRAAVRVRLAHVPAEHKGVLEAVAVYGRRVDFDILLGVTHTSEAALLDALDALVRRRLLREEADGGVYDYSHDKLREVVYRDIGGARRRLLHLAVAEAIERHPDAAGHDRAARLGEHYERAHAWAQALHHLVEAAQQSQALFALPDALHWFDRAVALCEAHGAVIDEARGLQIHALRGAARAQAGLTGAAADAPRLAANRHTRSPWPPGSAA